MSQLAVAQSVPAWLIVLARIFVGLTFLLSDHGSGAPGEFIGFVTIAATRSAPHWYQVFLHAVVLPRAAMFAMLVIVAEIYIGIALILGLTTRLASVLALFLLVNYWLAKSGIGIPGIDTAVMVLVVIIFVSAAGRIFGLDRFLYRRFPGLQLW